jgi:hypothetical protein
MPVEIHLNPGWEERLQHDHAVVEAVAKAAEQIADRVRSQGIKVGDLTADGFENIIDIPVIVGRKGEDPQVLLAHPAGIAVQAKYGALTKAASSCGLSVGGGGG